MPLERQEDLGKQRVQSWGKHSFGPVGLSPNASLHLGGVCLVAQSYLTLWSSLDCSPQAPQWDWAECWNGLPPLGAFLVGVRLHLCCMQWFFFFMVSFDSLCLIVFQNEIITIVPGSGTCEDNLFNSAWYYCWVGAFLSFTDKWISDSGDAETILRRTSVLLCGNAVRRRGDKGSSGPVLQ